MTDVIVLQKLIFYLFTLIKKLTNPFKDPYFLKQNTMRNIDLWSYFPKTISKKQASDTGMAAVLVLLLIGLFTNNTIYYKIAIPVLVINMTYPMFYKLLAIIWLGFSQLLGTVVSKIILTIIYIIMVIPVGVFRKLLGKDSLQLSEFKKGNQSVMQTRDYTFLSKDIEKPF